MFLQKQTESDPQENLVQAPQSSPPFHFRQLPEPPAGNNEEEEDSKDKEHLNEINITEEKEGKIRVPRKNKRSKKKEAKERSKHEAALNDMQKSGKETEDSIDCTKRANENVAKNKVIEDDDICEKCHHKKGPIKRHAVKQKEERMENKESKSTDESDLSQRRTREEKEILKRYITETPSNELYCNCYKYTVDSHTLIKPKVRCFI